MTGMSVLHAICSFLCILIALFFFLRLVNGCRWVTHFDAGNEVGHGMMAIGMLFMLAPAGWFSAELLHWNMLVFAAASLGWTCRLVGRKQRLALLVGNNATHSPIQSEVRSDAIQIFMHGGMCYLFLLMGSMLLSMMKPVLYISCLFCLLFACLALFFGREISQDLQAASLDRLQLGAHLAHALMSGMMCWMLFEMIAMTMAMRG
ncbi:MAG: hypothetical protein ACLQUY_24525 [Ktedonobacterales bacterium]